MKPGMTEFRAFPAITAPSSSLRVSINITAVAALIRQNLESIRPEYSLII
jgi:hypothetical protein